MNWVNFDDFVYYVCFNVFTPDLPLVVAQLHTCAHELPLVKENSDF